MSDRQHALRGEEEGGEPATQSPPISHDDPDKTIKTSRGLNTRLVQDKTKKQNTKQGSRTILFTVETQEELRRGFYPSIGGALG